MISYKTKIDQLLGQYQHLKKSIKDEQSHLEKARQTVVDAEEAQKIIQNLSEATQNKVHGEISSVVTSCLQSVFGEEKAYTFSIVFEQKRGKTEARLVFIREGHELEPLKESGGGCADIAGLALRLSCLVLSKPQRRRVLILDEPFKGVSEEYRSLVPELLMTLAKEMKCQIIFVTNIKDYVCGKVINLEDL